MTPGALLYHLYHRPVGAVRRSWREGGPIVQWATERHRREMVAAATQLPMTPQNDSALGPVHLMTGRRFWYQTAFCLHSLARAAGAPVSVELYDDGSLDEATIEPLLGLGAPLRIHRRSELDAQLDSRLPRDRFPIIRDRCEHYPNIRKIVDVHIGGGGWKLVLDSDLLFFRRPDALLNWLGSPSSILHAIDCDESYGYSRGLLEQVAGVRLPGSVNVGVCGLHSDSIDWAELERWIATLQSAEGTNYYLEQAVVAMWCGRQPATALDAIDYVTLPAREEVEHPRAVMHHYVATAKRWYFRSGWRHFAPLT